MPFDVGIAAPGLLDVRQVALARPWRCRFVSCWLHIVPRAPAFRSADALALNMCAVKQLLRRLHQLLDLDACGVDQTLGVTCDLPLETERSAQRQGAGNKRAKSA